MKSNVKSSLLTLLSLSLIALFAVGCGNSREDFVITNNNNQTGNGNLVFRFQQATTQTIVPLGTVALRFDLFSTNPGTTASLVSTETFDFAEVITLTDVPPNVVFVAVTALDGNGLPTVVRTAPVTVVPGGNVEVALDDTVPVTFDSLSVTPEVVNFVFNEEGDVRTQQLAFTGTFSGETFGIPITTPPATFVYGDRTIGNISATGLLTVDTTISEELLANNTTVTAGYTFLNTTQNDTFIIRTFVMEAFTDGDNEIGVGETYDNGYDVEVRNSSGVLTVNPEGVTFALASPVTGVSIDSQTGVVTTTSSTPTGIINVTISYVEPDTGVTLTAPVEIEVVESMPE